MDKSKRERLKDRGWRIGSAEDFLELSSEESAYVEIKLALAEHLRKRRRQKSLTQAALAKHLNSSQSRIAKMECGDASVSLDLLIRSLLALGVDQEDLARIISSSKSAA